MLDAVGDELEAVVLVHQRAQPTSDDVLELGNYDAYWDTVGHPPGAREHIGRGGERVTPASPFLRVDRHPPLTPPRHPICPPKFTLRRGRQTAAKQARFPHIPTGVGRPPGRFP